MLSRIAAALIVAFAPSFWTGAALAEADPLRDPATSRIRASFKVDGIALFDAHAQHAARMGICAPSVFVGLKWCVSGTNDEKKDDTVYAKTTGYNIDADSRIVYAISSRRGYPLKRDAFEGIVQAVGERFGDGATVVSFKKASGDTPAADSVIAVWGGARLVQLTESEYAQVEGGQSLKRGHLVDHRFNLVLSAKLRDPVYKIEGEAGFILQLMVTAPDRADIVLRTVYPPSFLPPPGRPSAEAGHPLVGETVRRAPRAASSERAPERSTGPADDRHKRVDAERGLAAERLLREEAERKIADEKATRAEVERLAAEERRAFEREKRKLDDERKAAEERAARAEASLKATAERRSLEEAQRRATDAKRADEERRAEADRKADSERKAEAGRKADAEAARRAEAQRLEDERKAAEQRRVDERAAPRSEPEAKIEAERPPPEAARTPLALWSFTDTQDRIADERLMRAQAIFGAPDGSPGGSLAVEITFDCRAVGRDRRLRAYARGFDRKSLSGVAFRVGGEDSFGVRAQIRLDGQAPQQGLLFREQQDDIASILEIPMSAAERARDVSRAAVWLRHDAVFIEFPLASGTVAATIAPKAANLRRVLEACAQ